MTRLRSFSGLKWVGSEINETVRRARDALEEYVEGGGETAILGPCVEHLNQVRGVLEMLQLLGPARLADEMQLAAKFLHDGQASHPDEVAEALMLSMIQLPDYLEKLESGGEDLPVLLLPAINDLRLSRSAPLLNDVDLLVSGMVHKSAARIPGSQQTIGLCRLALEVRPRLHKGLLNWFRGLAPEQGIAVLRDVFAELETESAGEPLLRGVFRTTHAVIEGLLDQSIESNKAVKGLVGRVDRVVKQLADQGVEAAAGSIEQAVIKDLLALLAKARSENAVIRAVQADYALDTAFPDQQALEAGRRRMQAPNANALGGVKTAAVKELLPIKDTLDLYMRGGREQAAQLGELGGPMTRLANTLEMAGLADLARRLRERAVDLKSIVSAQQAPDDALLMRVASDLLYVESSLDNVLSDSSDNSAVSGAAQATNVPQGELKALLVRTLDEAAVDMAKAKEAIVVYIDNPGDTRPLESTPQLFHGVAGALRVIGRENAADVLDQISEFIRRALLGSSQSPGMQVLEGLADAITGIEYYMEAVVEDRSDTEEILSIAYNALARLGQELEPVETAEQAPPEAGAESSVLEASPAATEEAQRAAALEDDAESLSDTTQTLDQIDPEILEIFLEEAKEEEPVIQEYYRRWREDLGDTEALTTFRRSFHTLKGSGRLAGAMTIGEFSWSVESLLNRIIEQTLSPSDEIFSFLDNAVASVPELIEAQEQERTPTIDVEAFVAQAQKLAESREQESTEAADLDSEPLADDEASSELIEEELSETSGEDSFAVEDSELRDIFQAEALEHLDVLQAYLAACSQQFAPYPINEEVVRSLHTLAGSARMTGLEPIAVVAKGLERKGGALLDDDIAADDAYIDLLREGVGAISAMVDHLTHRTTLMPDTDELLTQIEAYASPTHSAGSAYLDADEGEAIELEALTTDLDDAVSAESLSETVDTGLSDDEIILSEPLITPPDQEAIEITPLPSSESSELEVELNALLPERQGDGLPAESMPTSDEETGLSSDLPLVAAQEDVLSLDIQAPTEDVSPLDHRFGEGASDEVDEATSAEPLESLAAEADENRVEPDEDVEILSLDAELAEIFLEEAEELLDRLDGGLRDFAEDLSDADISNEVQRTLHTLKGGARLAGIQSIGNLSHALESLVRRIEPGLPADEQAQIDLAQRAADQLLEQVQAVKQGVPVPLATALLARLESKEALVEAKSPELEPSSQHLAAPPLPEVAPPMVEEAMEVFSGEQEMVDIFLDEAEDLLDQLDRRLHLWVSQPDDEEAPVQLKRTLHTLKGGARLAGVPAIGDLSHALETLLEGLTPDKVRRHASVLPLAQRAADRLSGQIESLRDSGAVQTAHELISELEYVHEDLLDVEDSGASLAEVAVKHSGPPLAPAPAPVPAKSAAAPVRPAAAQEQVRVRSDLLNRLVNNAGEISIYRARLEQQNTTLGFNLGELDQTVVRLHDQLRQMEIETEAQILYRYEQEREEGKDPEDEFDPLELDRFSTIQQLSRSLIETVNDLSSIRNLLDDQQKESETLLLQHARISNDLQDGLLRTRMVPFSQLAPRLLRLVRQTAGSLNKRAMLEVIGGEGEMDRSILDRMLAPMEHILRNAVSHGIETAEVRRAAGKDETGRITIYLNREGNDVVITVSDDGAGLNLDAIRRRAIERGLLEPGAKIKDDDVMQLVLEPGFSTVKEVTQISGRGVGTDVVVSEVKQMGGSLEIDSQPGRGTSFSIRLPFTLAISEALLVELGDEVFAVPHPTIEGVVRINIAELTRCYEGKQASFQYAGHDYQVRYLGNLLGTLGANIADGRKWLPLMLVRSGEHRVAIQVDRILGNRQIVVKSVGVQLSSVRWISGGTILADGRVALILDVSALVRMDVVHSTSSIADMLQSKAEQQVKVMVVDDSITVRKVTTRLLKRHNMEVITAKDGVDAVAQLQEQKPDVMLLDIEMPRMDGYELARHMRNSGELSDIPIIMITSRTGDKHRNLALSLGVKRYLGKPYQETDLLDNIYAILAESEVGV